MTHLIDGHNLIGSGLVPGIHLQDPDDEERLLQWLRARRAPAGAAEMIVFFDSGAAGGLGPVPTVGRAAPASGGVMARYCRPGEEADDAIVAYLSRQRQPGQFTVVTNDSELAHRVRFAGANVVTAAHFTRRLTRSTAARRPHSPDRPAAAPERPLPGVSDPAFADIQASFLEAEKAARLKLRAGDLDPAVLAGYVESNNPELARQAAALLGRVGGPAAVEPLRGALVHSDAGVRAAAALALSTLGGDAALQDLIERLTEDDNSMVREAAAQALGRIGDRRAGPALETAGRSDRRSKVRKAAQAALTQIRARRG